MPSTAAASVRAMITNDSSVRASTAALTRSTISSFDTTSLPGRWPQRFCPTWSSMCTAATPTLMKERMVRADVEGAAPAGVDVDQQRHLRRIDDPARVGEHVFHRADAEVGHAQRIGGDAAAGQVQRLVAGALGHQAGVRGDGAHHLQRRFCRDGGAEARAGGGLRHVMRPQMTKRPCGRLEDASAAGAPRRRALPRARPASCPSRRG